MSEEMKTGAAARGHRKSRRGTVVRKSGDKTISVLVERRYAHPVYGKQITETKKYHVHDEKNEAGVGDIVVIAETRPLSATKRWRLEKIASIPVVHVWCTHSQLSISIARSFPWRGAPGFVRRPM